MAEPKGFGRIRLRCVPTLSEDSLLPFVCEAIEPGSVVHTDGSWAYRSLNKHGYTRRKSVLTGSLDPAHVSMSAVHRVRNQLDHYLDEYTFRFNRRTSRSCGLLFYRLLEQAMDTEPTTYRDIVGENT